MKLFVLGLCFAATAAMAQPPPLYPPPPNRQGVPYDLRDQSPNHPQWDQRERRRQWHENRRWCRQWRYEHPNRRHIPERCR